MGVLRNQSIKNSINFYIGMGIGAINTILIYPNVFNHQPEHWGLIQILVAYAMVVSAFSHIGMPKVFIRFSPAILEKGQLLFLSLLGPLFGFLITFLGYVVFKEQILSFVNATPLLKDNFIYVVLLVFFISFYDVLAAVSISYFSTATPIFFNEVFLRIYGLIILLLHGFKVFDFEIFLKLFVLGYFVKLLILLLIQIKHRRLSIAWNLKDLRVRELMNFGFYVIGAGTSAMIVSRVDMLMIGMLIDLKHVAFYTVAFFIGNAIKVPARSIGSISTPLLAKADKENNKRQIQSIYSKSSINQLIIGGVFFLCIWLNIDDIFSMLPEKFSHGKYVVLFIGLAQLFNVTTGVNGLIIIYSKYYRFNMFSNILLLIITIAFNYILIPEYGINGAAVATAISVFLFYTIKMIFVYVKMGMHPFNIKTLYTIILLFSTLFIVGYMPITSNIFIDIILRSLLVLILFVPLMLWLKLSEDINKIIVDVRKQFGL